MYVSNVTVSIADCFIEKDYDCMGLAIVVIHGFPLDKFQYNYASDTGTEITIQLVRNHIDNIVFESQKKSDDYTLSEKGNYRILFTN